MGTLYQDQQEARYFMLKTGYCLSGLFVYLAVIVYFLAFEVEEGMYFYRNLFELTVQKLSEVGPIITIKTVREATIVGFILMALSAFIMGIRTNFRSLKLFCVNAAFWLLLMPILVFCVGWIAEGAPTALLAPIVWIMAYIFGVLAQPLVDFGRMFSQNSRF